MALQKIFSKLKWLWLALLALLIRWGAVHHPDLVESLYSRGFFKMIRVLLGTAMRIIPFPPMYLLIGLVLYFLIKKIVQLSQKNQSWGRRLQQFSLSIINLLSALVFFFLVLWGYNYQRVSIEQHMGFAPKPVTVSELQEELEWLTPILVNKRNALENTTEKALDQGFFPEDLETTVNEAVRAFLIQQGFPDYYKANGRFLKPKGVLLYNSTAGIYFPWVGESHIDAGLHPLSQPYVLAHEFAHAYGWGDEGTCNFIAYLACAKSQHPFVQYTGILGYWRTLASNYRRYQPKKYTAFRAKLPEGIRADLDAINDTHQQYPDLFPRFRHATYDAFLKAQGIDEGLENYNRVIMLGRAWRLSGTDFSLSNSIHK